MRVCGHWVDRPGSPGDPPDFGEVGIPERRFESDDPIPIFGERQPRLPIDGQDPEKTSWDFEDPSISESGDEDAPPTTEWTHNVTYSPSEVTLGSAVNPEHETNQVVFGNQGAHEGNEGALIPSTTDTQVAGSESYIYPVGFVLVFDEKTGDVYNYAHYREGEPLLYGSPTLTPVSLREEGYLVLIASKDEDLQDKLLSTFSASEGYIMPDDVGEESYADSTLPAAVSYGDDGTYDLTLDNGMTFTFTQYDDEDEDE